MVVLFFGGTRMGVFMNSEPSNTVSRTNGEKESSGAQAVPEKVGHPVSHSIGRGGETGIGQMMTRRRL
jgi:hypothetical protein